MKSGRHQSEVEATPQKLISKLFISQRKISKVGIHVI
jgi:hypothetical protein